MQVVFNSPSLHLTPVPDREAGESPSDLLLTQSRVPSCHLGRGQQSPSTLTSTITVRVDTTANTSRIPSPSPNSISRRRRDQEMEIQPRREHPTRTEQEEDTESKLMELHKQVQKLLQGNWLYTLVSFQVEQLGLMLRKQKQAEGPALKVQVSLKWRLNMLVVSIYSQYI